MNTPKSYLQMIAAQFNPVPLAIELALSHGLELQVQAHQLKRGKLGRCFKNTIMGAYEHALLYCEGWATSPTLGGLAIDHAWCVDPETMGVIDLTWKHPESEYFGVVLNLRDVATLIIETQTYGVFGDLHRRQPVEKTREWLRSIVWKREGVN